MVVVLFGDIEWEEGVKTWGGGGGGGVGIVGLLGGVFGGIFFR